MTQPNILTVPFAESAAPQTIQEIPISRDPSDPIQKATWSTGFPAATMQPLSTGGVPPMGQDFNGILKALSEHIVYQNKGGVYRWSADVVSAGGYNKGAVVQDTDGLRSYVSLIDGNTEPLNGSNWLLISMPIATQAQAQGLTSGDTLITPKTLADAFKGANQSLFGSGYQKLPGGLIIQWGTLSCQNDVPTTGPLPIAFPVGPLQGVAIHDDPSQNVSPTVSLTFSGASQVRIVARSSTGTSFVMRYIVLGR